jgi:hypothetical protein
MELLCSYYKLDRNGDRLSRSRCHEHIASHDPIRGTVKPLCGAAMDTEQYVWKEIQGEPKYLCRDCKLVSSKPSSDLAALQAWVSGEPIR